MLNFPVTYQNLQKLNILRDYTLGFAREAGFRAGIARPYHFYDLEKEEQSDLIMVPFQYMDGTLQQYKRCSPEEAKEIIKILIDETKRVGGLFVSLWHNTSLTDEDEWKGWRDVFEFSLKEQRK
jgi:hypothetical protein